MSKLVKSAPVVEHSAKFNKVKKYFEYGFWTVKMCHDAVTKGWITEAEFTEITGEEF